MRRWRMGSYSKDLRLKVLAATERGTPRREVVETFGVSLATLKLWLKKRREGEDLSPKSSTGRKRRILSSAEQKRGVKVSIATMSRAIRHRLGWTLGRPGALGQEDGALCRPTRRRRGRSG